MSESTTDGNDLTLPFEEAKRLSVTMTVDELRAMLAEAQARIRDVNAPSNYYHDLTIGMALSYAARKLNNATTVAERLTMILQFGGCLESVHNSC